MFSLRFKNIQTKFIPFIYNPRVRVLCEWVNCENTKMKTKKVGMGVRSGKGLGQGGCEPRIEVIVKMHKKIVGVGLLGPRGLVGGRVCGCEPRIEVIVKMQKNKSREVGVGVR